MDNELIDLLRTVSSGFQARMQEQVAAEGSGLTAFQARLVNLIGRHDGVSQLALGSFTDRDKAQIARAVKELEVRGLVARAAHASDWRSKCLSLTEAGRQMQTCLNEARRALATEVLGGFSDEEKATLRASFEKMAASLRYSVFE